MSFNDDATTFPHTENDENKMVILSGRDRQKYFDVGQQPLRRPLQKSKFTSKEAFVRGIKTLFKMN